MILLHGTPNTLCAPEVLREGHPFEDGGLETERNVRASEKVLAILRLLLYAALGRIEQARRRTEGLVPAVRVTRNTIQIGEMNSACENALTKGLLRS